jgi:hypothetical protein
MGVGRWAKRRGSTFGNDIIISCANYFFSLYVRKPYLIIAKAVIT